MGLKIQNSGLPPMKVLISKKLHIIRPAIEYMQQISKPKKVRLSKDVDVFYCFVCGGAFSDRKMQLQTFSHCLSCCAGFCHAVSLLYLTFCGIRCRWGVCSLRSP